jgi:hypothetical protein
VDVTVVEDAGLSYLKNVMIEQFTGTWCGYCPRAIHQVSSLLLTEDQVVHIAYHLNDEFDYSLNSNLFSGFGFTGVPSMIADRRKTWMGEKNEISTFFNPSRVGIEAAVSGTKDELTVEVSLTFGKKFADNIALAVYLVHDSLVADQSSYYNNDPSSPWYGAGDNFPGFVHDNVMVKNLTDLYGDQIPSSSVDIGSVYEKEFQTGNFRCEDIEQIKAVIFVAYSDGVMDGYILNAGVCEFGSELELILAEL